MLITGLCICSNCVCVFLSFRKAPSSDKSCAYKRQGTRSSPRLLGLQAAALGSAATPLGTRSSPRLLALQAAALGSPAKASRAESSSSGRQLGDFSPPSFDIGFSLTPPPRRGDEFVVPISYAAVPDKGIIFIILLVYFYKRDGNLCCSTMIRVTV